MRDRPTPDLPAGTTSFPPSPERPEGFPPELPFVPGLECQVVQVAAGGGIVSCTWSVPERDGGERLAASRARMRELEGDAAEIPLVLRMMRSWEGAGAPAEGSRERWEALRAIVSDAPGDQVEAMRRWGESQREALRPGPETVAEVARVQDAVIARSVSDGWTVESDQEMPVAPESRLVVLRKGGRVRSVTGIRMVGLGTVMLSEAPDRSR